MNPRLEMEGERKRGLFGLPRWLTVVLTAALLAVLGLLLMQAAGVPVWQTLTGQTEESPTLACPLDKAAFGDSPEEVAAAYGLDTQPVKEDGLLYLTLRSGTVYGQQVRGELRLTFSPWTDAGSLREGRYGLSSVTVAAVNDPDGLEAALRTFFGAQQTLCTPEEAVSSPVGQRFLWELMAENRLSGEIPRVVLSVPAAGLVQVDGTWENRIRNAESLK